MHPTLTLALLVLAATEPSTTNQAGLAGVDRLLLAEPRPAGEIVGGLQVGYFQTRGLLRDDSFHERQQSRLYLTWSPLAALTVGYSHTLTANYDAAFVPASRDTLGNPRLTALGSLRLNEAVSVGLGLELWLPTAGVRGLRLEATTPTLTSALTWRTGALRLGGNLGYRYNRSDSIFPQKRDRAHEFANDVAFADQVILALGGDWTWAVAAKLRLIPFVETYFEYAPRVALAKNSLAATLGSKLELVETPLQVSLGARLRVSGDPQQTGRIPGLPPYEVIAGLAYRFGAEAHFPERCAAQTACADGFRCIDGLCLKSFETVVERAVEPGASSADCAPTEKTFLLSGTVVDSTTTKPVSWARVRVGGDQGVLMAADGEGVFHSCPVPAAGGILTLQLEAAGYQPLDTAVPRGAAGETLQATFELLPASEQFATVRGSVMNPAGESLSGCTVSVPEAKATAQTDERGTFDVKLPVGRYTLKIACRGFRSQNIPLTFTRPGEVVVFNADMEPR